MTKRDTMEEPQAAKPLTLKKETVKDLDPRRRGEEIRGGRDNNTSYCQVGGDSGKET